MLICLRAGCRPCSPPHSARLTGLGCFGIFALGGEGELAGPPSGRCAHHLHPSPPGLPAALPPPPAAQPRSRRRCAAWRADAGALPRPPSAAPRPLPPSHPCSGPGCSSLGIGLFQEIGPFSFDFRRNISKPALGRNAFRCAPPASCGHHTCETWSEGQGRGGRTQQVPPGEHTCRLPARPEGACAQSALAPGAEGPEGRVLPQQLAGRLRGPARTCAAGPL